LRLARNGIHGDGALALAQSPVAARLELLDLSENPIGPLAAQALVSLPALHTLLLSHAQIGDDGLLAWLASTLPPLPAFAAQALGNRAAASLATSPELAHLETLSLWNNSLGAEGAAALAASAYLDKVTELNLAHNPLGDAGAVALASAPWLSGLSALY